MHWFIETNANCTNLWLGYYYCVAPYPPFNASSATAPLITGTVGSVYAYPIPTANYTPTLNSQIITPAGVPAPTNVAQGTKQVACGYYYTVQVRHSSVLESSIQSVPPPVR